MKPDVARIWADALDSGEYNQGYGVLCRLDDETGGRAYCCLGVLCMAAIEAGVEVSTYLTDPEFGKRQVYFNGKGGYLPLAVQEWAGLDNMCPLIAGRPATYWNDSGRKSFSDIAAKIRADINSEERVAAI